VSPKLDSDLSSDSSNTLLVRYLDGDGVDQPLARIVASGPNAGVAAYLSDRQGSVRDLMDWTGAVRDHLDYDGFGNPAETAAGFGDRYGYTGREWDRDTKLLYHPARPYDPWTGRWAGEDPLGLGPDSNVYRYVANGPTNATDPTGLKGGGSPAVTFMTIQVAIHAILGDGNGGRVVAGGAGAPAQPGWWQQNETDPVDGPQGIQLLNNLPDDEQGVETLPKPQADDPFKPWNPVAPRPPRRPAFTLFPDLGLDKLGLKNTQLTVGADVPGGTLTNLFRTPAQGGAGGLVGHIGGNPLSPDPKNPTDLLAVSVRPPITGSKPFVIGSYTYFGPDRSNPLFNFSSVSGAGPGKGSLSATANLGPTSTQVGHTGAGGWYVNQQGQVPNFPYLGGSAQFFGGFEFGANNGVGGFTYTTPLSGLGIDGSLGLFGGGSGHGGHWHGGGGVVIHIGQFTGALGIGQLTGAALQGVGGVFGPEIRHGPQEKVGGITAYFLIPK
jgi:RHS repeat-associated protein